MSIVAPDAGGQDTGVATRDHKLSEYLYERLPALYRVEDAKLGQTPKEAARIVPSVDLSDLDARSTSEFQLQRFLRIFGSGFNAMRTSLDSTLLLLDVDRIEPKWLIELAKVLGWNINLELPVDLQRLELKNAVNFYRQKGRQSVIDFMIQQLTDFTISYSYARDRLLTTFHKNQDFRFNPSSHLFLTGEETNIGTQLDNNYYLFGTRAANNSTDLSYGVQYVFVYLTQNLLNQDVVFLTSKIERLANEFVPWGVELIFIVDSFYGESDWDTAAQSTDSGHEQMEAWPTDHHPWLYTWAPRTIFGYDSTGVLVPTGGF